MSKVLTAVSSDLLSLEDHLLRALEEIRGAQMVVLRLPAGVSGCASAKRSFALAETMLNCLREEMHPEFLAASREKELLDCNLEVPF